MAKPLDKMTKPELVKALKAAQKRIAKLEGFAAQAAANELIRNPGPYDVSEHRQQRMDEANAELALGVARLPWETE